MKETSLDEPLRVVMSGDLMALPMLSTCVASIVRHTLCKRVEVDIYTRAIALPEDIVTERLTVHFRRPPQSVECSQGRLPSEMFDRLWVMEERTEWSRCLVWDWDMIAVGNIDEMYNVEMEDQYGAYVVSPKRTTYIQNNWTKRGAWAKEMPGAEQVYFRFGGLMNLDKCRQDQIMKQMLEWSYNGSTEQALLACVMMGNYKPLETKWNVLPSIEQIPQDARVLHFFGTRKPWTHPDVKGIESWVKEQTSWNELRKGI